MKIYFKYFLHVFIIFFFYARDISFVVYLNLKKLRLNKHLKKNVS